MRLVLNSLKTNVYFSKVIRKLSINVVSRDRTDLLQKTWKSFLNNCIQSKLSRQNIRKAIFKSNRSTKIKVWARLKIHHSNQFSIKHSLHNFLMRKKHRLFNALYLACNTQRSHRDRFIDFASSRLKNECLTLFKFWTAKALATRTIRESLLTRQHFLLSRLVIKRFRQNAALKRHHR